MGFVIVVLAIAIFVAIFMACAGLVVGLSGVLFLDYGFVDAWNAAWDRPLVLFIFAVIASILMRTIKVNRNNNSR